MRAFKTRLLGVRGQLLLFGLAPVLGTGLAMSLGFYAYARSAARRQMVACGDALASGLAEQARAGVETGDVFRTLERLAEASVRREDVALVRILDREGRPLARAGTGRPSEMVLRRPVLSKAELLGRPARAASDRRTIGATAQLPPTENSPPRGGRIPGALPHGEGAGSVGGGPERLPIGEVELHLSMDSFHARMRHAAAVSAGALTAAAFAVLLAAFAVARRITRPIEAMARAAEAIARGEYGVTVPRLEDDELGELADAFNGMSLGLMRTAGYLDAVVDGTPVPLLVIHSDGTVRRANRAANALLGYGPTELKGRPLESVFSAPQPFQGEAMERLLLQGRSGEMQARILAQGGVDIPVRLSSSLLKDHDGRPYGIVALLDAYGGNGA